MRISPPRVFPQATHAARPPADAAGAADAYRQCRFVLGEELDTVLDILSTEGRIADEAAGSKYRNQVVAATLTAWSGSWLHRLQALHSIEWGNAVASLALLKAAAQSQQAVAVHLATDATDWEQWTATGIAQDAALHAMEFRLQAESQSTASASPELDEIGAMLAALTGSSFGGAVFLTAADSSPDRIAPTYGDRDFHLGLSEIILGLLLQLGALQLEAVLAAADRLPVADPEATQKLVARARKLIARADRCRIESLSGDHEGRYLVHHYRRAPSGAPKRVLL